MASVKSGSWKRIFKIFVAVLIFLFMFIRITGQQEVYAAGGSSFSSASNITLGSTINDSITSNQGNRYYKFTLSESGKVKLKYVEIDDFSPIFTIYDEDNSKIWGTSNVYETKEFTIDLVKGTYYLKVNAYWSTGEYTIKTLFESAKESYSGDNSTWKKANIVNLESTFNGQIAENRKQDYYKFILSSSGKINLKYIETDDISPILTIYDEDNSKIWGTSNVYGTEEFKIDLEKGTYYLKVDAYWSTGTYCLKLLYDPTNAGWRHDGKGWWYRNSDFTYPRNCWKKISGSWYHFNASGYMQTGWQAIGGKWYYLGSANDGAMKVGWQKISGKWYFFNGSGEMQTGWVKVGSVWYYMNKSGAMLTGWQAIDGRWYYLQSNGAMKTGWLKSGGKWYYLNSSGAMVTNTWVGGYYLKADGSMR